MIGKKINQLATELAPVSTDLTIIGDPDSGVSKKITLAQLGAIFSGAVSFYTNLAAFPTPGTTDVIYCAKDTQKLYLWSGSAYVEVFPSQALLDTYQLRSEKGNANGYASLDSGGKVPISQLPSSIMEYKGTWNASTNTPTLANGTGDTGDVYICNVAGTVNFGAGPITFAVGDYVIYSGTIWQRSSGAVGTVTSVAASITGDAIGITGSPITTSGTLALAFAGTSAQYINGAGNLTTFPTSLISGSGASGQVTFFNGANSVTGTNNFFWDATNNRLGIGTTTPQRSIEIYNTTADNHLRLSGNAPSVSMGEAVTGSIYQAKFGLVTTNGQFVSAGVAGDFVIISQTGATIIGTSSTEKMRVNTSGNVSINNTNNTYKLDVTGTGRYTGQLRLESTITDGTNTYTLPSATGTLALTSQIPSVTGYVPYTGATANLDLGTHTLIAAKGTFSSSGSGDTVGITHSSGSGIALNITKGGSGEGLYINKTSGSGNAATIIGTLNATTLVKSGGTSSQFLKADGSVDSTSYGTGSVTSVGLSSATSGVTIGSTPITTSGTITLAIATASGSQQGLLSSTDWTTFNSKQNALTNPVTGTGTTNYLPKFTGTSTIGDSQIFDNGTNVGIGTASPDAILHIAKSNSGGIGGQLVIDNPVADALNNAVEISFLTAAGASGSGIRNARIQAVEQNASTGAANIQFWTYNGSTDAERMRLDASGNLSIGNTNDTFKLEVTGEGRFYQSATSSTAYLRVENNRSRNAAVRLTTTLGDYYLGVGIGADVNQFQIFDGNAGATRFTIASTGAATFTAATQDAIQTVVRMSGNNASGQLKTLDFKLTAGTPLWTISTAAVGTDAGINIMPNGSAGLSLAYSTGAATFSSSVTTGGNVFIPNGNYYYAKRNTSGDNINVLGFASGSDTLTIKGGTSGSAASIQFADTGGTIATFYNSNFGIGTTSPSRNLTVKQSVNSYLGGFSVERNDNNNYLGIFNDGSIWNIAASYLSGGSYQPIGFFTSDVERMRITSGGLVGIGTSAPGNYYSTKLVVAVGDEDGITIAGSGDNFLMFADGQTGLDRYRGFIHYSHDTNFLAFGSDGAERMRITSGGDLIVGATSIPGAGSSTTGVSFGASGYITAQRAAATVGYFGRSNDGELFAFYNNTTQVGNISVAASSTSYNTSSDYRLKQDFKDYSGLDLVNKIKTYDYEWKSDKTRSYGVIAHELQSVINYAVTGVKDGKEMQGVDYSKIVPVLIKAIQEQQTQIEQLKNK
jgi:hypothetical protein